MVWVHTNGECPHNVIILKYEARTDLVAFTTRVRDEFMQADIVVVDLDPMGSLSTRVVPTKWSVLLT
jgi:hypothetical protein